jgi:hypothetical protein
MIFNDLKRWREERHITGYDHYIQVSNIVEETLELMYTPKSVAIKQLQRDIMEHYVDDTTNEEKIDAYCDLIVFSINAIELLGYDAKMAMKETIKEISSRKQNPAQQTIWLKWGYDNTKWEKDKNQPKEELYKANYSKFKRKETK